MYFPVSGVEVNPLVPLLVAFFVSLLTAPAGVSGAFLLLPFQVSVLGFTGPAVSPTNLIYNIVATPGGIYTYIKERRMVWPLAWVVVLGTLPGVFVGAILRVRYLSDPALFKVFVGLVLLYLGARLLYETAGSYLKERLRREPVQQNLFDYARRTGTEAAPESPPFGEVVRPGGALSATVEYEFRGKVFSFNKVTVFLLSLVVGAIGGVYGVGGGAIIAPFLVAFLRLPVYTIAGAALLGTFLTSFAGVAFFQLLSATELGRQAAVAPDWTLGGILGIGGLAGTYAGARLQKFLPDFWIRVVLGTLITLLALSYLLG
ncbi:MAG: sulfite exporter TauE/SafE family protein [Rubrobacter sp.]|nr:sulfite exporter TauE/SafE family protein [Rubrobacter sp.]